MCIALRKDLLCVMSKQPMYVPRQPCRVLVVACAGMLIAISALRAQSAASPQAQAAVAKVPAYDVVSIKPNKTGSGNVSISVDDGNFNAPKAFWRCRLLQNCRITLQAHPSSRQFKNN